tara:strand:- start:67 stop:456 length:390 start_codon:yes stop_codon:yes gene_type:complete
LQILDNFDEIFLVSLGACFGANTRFLICNQLYKKKICNQYVILIINILASFFLGFYLSILPRISFLNFSYQLSLFFSIGFLGALSSFSTFVYDLFDLLLKLKFVRAIRIFIFSYSLGIIALGIGFLLGH